MLCDSCGKNQATVHLTEIIDDQMTELHLCEECAHKKSSSMEQQFGLNDLLAGLAGFNKTNKEDEMAAVKCPSCRLTYADFKKFGRLGCGECYNVFRKYLSPLLKRIHGSVQHVGKSPSRRKAAAAAGTILKKKAEAKADIHELRLMLQKAIEKEEFEEAARLRDQIKEIEKSEKPKQGRQDAA